MPLTVGSRLGPYEILSPLGAGGMGEVYRARDTRLGRDVAIKLVHPRFASDAEQLRRFEQEARAASQLDHPNILVVHDVGSHEGSPYIVSELLDGESLRDKIGAPLPPKKAVQYALQVAHGLAAAHEKGIVHRDIKPENVFVTRDGRIKILDFGVAKLTQPAIPSVALTEALTAAPATDAGVVVGTVGYMSPEQVLGKPLDSRSDLFSLGVVLYELLSGKRPFQKDTAPETMAAILKEEPADLSGAERAVSPGLDRIVRHCLEKEPSNRFQSARDLSFDLEDLSRQQATSPSGYPAASHRFPRAVWIAAAIAALAGAALLLARLVSHPQAPSAAARGAADARPTRIVVLPFDNLGSSEDAYFAAGVTEEITSRLANVRRLGVISRTTATEYPRTGRTVKQIGLDLGVDWVLEGTIRCDRSGGGPGRVRITPQLIRVADDTHVWSERYDRTLTDIFSLQSDVATKTVEAIGISLVPSEKSSLETIPTKDLIAYDHYLKGLAAERRSTVKSDIEEAVGHFQEAVNRDPSFVPALAHLSVNHVQMYWLFYDRSAERLEKGRAAAEATARLGPDLPEAHDALGFLYYWGSRDYARATEEFEAARRIRPNDGPATYGLASVLRRLGRWEESAALFAEAARLDPRNTWILTNVGESLFLSRRYREADDSYATAISLSPNDGESQAFRIWLQVQWRGDLVRAKALLAEAERVPGLGDDQGMLGLNAYRLSLAERDFVGALGRLDADSRKAFSSQFFFFPVDLLRSQVYGLTGRTDECRRAAEKARAFLEGEIGKNPGDARLHSALGITLALLGRSEEALLSARRGVELMTTSKDAWIGLWRIEDLAFVCAMVGRQDEAIEQVGVLLSRSGEMTPHVLRLDPRWDRLRKNPKFDALLAKYEVKP